MADAHPAFAQRRVTDPYVIGVRLLAGEAHDDRLAGSALRPRAVYGREADNWVPTAMGRCYDALYSIQALHPPRRELVHPGAEQGARPSGR